MAETNAWLDSQVLNLLMHLTLLARSPMEGSVSGLHKSPHRGSSVEFAEYRNYVPGDDIRRLDWRVFARTDRFFLKEYEAETNLRCYFVLDASGSRSQKKSDTTTTRARRRTRSAKSCRAAMRLVGPRASALSNVSKRTFKCAGLRRGGISTAPLAVAQMRPEASPWCAVMYASVAIRRLA